VQGQARTNSEEFILVFREVRFIVGDRGDILGRNSEALEEGQRNLCHIQLRVILVLVFKTTSTDITKFVVAKNRFCLERTPNPISDSISLLTATKLTLER
jgi:hypothetical protein